MGISIADALFPKSKQQVLAVLFGTPDRSFYANELIALAGVGTGAVQRELTRLEAAGLVTSTRLGNQKHYQANRAAPVFDELRAIVSKTFGVTQVLQAALAPLAARILLAFVYGSVARQAAHAASDVDLLVVAEELAYGELLNALEPAQAELRRTVNPTVYTPAELARRVREGRSFVARVLEQPKLYLIGDDDGLAACIAAAKP